MSIIRFALLMTAAGCSGIAGDWITDRGGTPVKSGSGEVTEISFRSAWVTDSDLAHIAPMPHLSRLDLSLTRIGDSALEGVRNLPALAELDLTYAETIGDGALAHLRSLKNLKRLSLEGTTVTDSGMGSLAVLTTLESLNLRCTQITDAALERLEPLTLLEQLAIGGNRVTGNGLEYLRAFPRLKHLDLSGVQSTDSGLWSVSLTDLNMPALARLTGLESLNLAQPEIPGAGRFIFKDVLEIVRMQVTDLGIAQLRSLEKLRSLDLTGVNVTAQGIESLAGLPGLQNLVLAHAPHIDDSSVAAICRLRQLKTLDLRGTRVGDGSLRQLSGIRTLKKLNVSGAGVSADAVAVFRQQRPDCEVLRSE